MRIDQLDLELTELVLETDPSADMPAPARLTGRMRAAGILEELALDGSVQTYPGQARASTQIEIRGRALTFELATPYLEQAGIQPQLSGADLALDIEGEAELDDGVLRADLSLRGAHFTDGDTTWLSLDELKVAGLELGEAIAVEEIAVVRPYARLVRDSQSRVVAAGLRTMTAEVNSGTEEAVDPKPSPNASPTRATEAPTPTYPDLNLPELPAVRVGTFRIEGARVAFADDGFSDPVELELGANFVLSDFTTDGEPATFESALSIDGSVDALEANGSVTVSSAAITLESDVQGSGIRTGALAPVFPLGMGIDSQDAGLAVHVEARIAAAPEGGLSAGFAARDFSWSGAEDWLTFERLELAAPRLDPAGGLVEIGPIALDGLRVDASRDAAGRLHVLGLAIDPNAAGPSSGATVERETPRAAVAQASSESKPSSRPIPLPRVVLRDDIRFELAGLRFRDATLGDDARPLEAKVAFRLPGGRTLVDDNPAALPPIEWTIEGDVEGIVERFGVTGHLAPFAPDPAFDITLLADGVRTPGVLELAPELTQGITGEVENGLVEGRLEGVLFVQRTHPTDLGFSRPFGAEILVRDVAYREAPDSTVLIGIDQIQTEVKRIDSQRGLVHIQSVELVQPRGFVHRDDTVLRALGFAIDTAAMASATSDESAERASSDTGNSMDLDTEQDRDLSVAAVEASTPKVAEPIIQSARADASSASSSEVRIDLLTVSGIDFRIEDTTGEPPLELPIRGLDVEVKRFTTRAFEEPRPIQFAAFVEVGGESEAPVFEEMAASGRLALAPAPDGWAQFSMSGLELAPFSGMTGSGISLEGGSLDASARVRLKGERGMSVDSTIAFADLNVKEPEGGPIQTALSLPVTLDAALFLLRNSRGEHRFSTGLSIPSDGISMTSVSLAATKAVAEVLARALAGAPLRLLGAVMPGGDEEVNEARTTVVVPFVAAATEIELASKQRLAEVAAAMKSEKKTVAVMRHVLTQADVERAQVLANPPEAACFELSRGLRREKAELLRKRDELATEAYALHALRSDDAAIVASELRGAERELAAVETALDEVFEILRSNSPRRQERRTKGVAREIATLRLEQAAAVLEELIGRKAAERIEIRSPRFEVAEGNGGGSVVIELFER